MMKLKILGSVSPYCNKTSNCPGYLITNNNEKILLDCGNGITREMSFPNDLENLTVIISHLHRDHYGDLLTLSYASFVYNRLGMLKDKVKVYLPKDNQIDSDYLSRMKESFMEFVFYDAKTVIEKDDLKITFQNNPHPVTTYSTSLTSSNKKIVYSADTGYQNNTLEDFAKDADLFICETTFLKDQKGKEDNHLTTIEAGTIAKKAGVKKLLITHFWPEIPKVKYQLETKEIFTNTIIAEEGKVLTLRR